MICTACGNYCVVAKKHPLLHVPICQNCFQKLSKTDFESNMLYGKEIYCRWCSYGSGEIILCDNCSMSFCTQCITRNFGRAEVVNIKCLPHGWNCLICDPRRISALCEANNWNIDPIERSSLVQPYTTIRDISKGREIIEIPVINEVDSQIPEDFTYVNSYVHGEGVSVNTDPINISCCACVDDCKRIEDCPCQQLTKATSYDHNGVLWRSHQFGIYECNQHCNCHRSMCKNRVVGKGIQYPLYVFRCDNGKGWGVKCSTLIKQGTFVADYLGELLSESAAEVRGRTKCDEYLYTIDHLAKTEAVFKAQECGLHPNSVKKTDPSIFAMDENEIAQYVDERMVSLLKERGALERARLTGKKLRTEQSTKPLSVRDFEMRSKVVADAYPLLCDAVTKEMDQRDEMLTIDARWCGNVGRFINHSCVPNLDKIPVYTESRDKRMPRMCFFANDDISAHTELCYDYEYQLNAVEGKMKPCLCGAPNCRKLMY